MIFRRLKERSEGQALRRVQVGGLGEYAVFSYVVRPAAEAESLAVVFRDGHEIVREYLPAILEGVEQGRVALAECGEWFCSVQVEITSMRHHAMDGTYRVFVNLAKQFVQTTLHDACDALLSLDPTWRTPDVLTLARHAHQTRDFAALPLLADALEEAGCDFALLLEHCRSGCDHGGACWAVQLALAETG